MGFDQKSVSVFYSVLCLSLSITVHSLCPQSLFSVTVHSFSPQSLSVYHIFMSAVPQMSNPLPVTVGQLDPDQVLCYLS